MPYSTMFLMMTRAFAFVGVVPTPGRDDLDEVMNLVNGWVR